MTEKILFLRAEKITERLKEMKKILSAILTLSLAATAALSFPVSAGSYVTGDSAGLTYELPAPLDGGFEHPGLWNNISGGAVGQSAANSKITATDAASGRRSLYVGKTEGQDWAVYYNSQNSDWSKYVKYPVGENADWLYEFFFYADVKMSEDFVGSVYLKLISQGSNWYEGIANSAYKGEMLLFDNTDKGMYATFNNSSNNADVPTPNAPNEAEGKARTVYTDWTRVKSIDYGDGFRFGTEQMKTIINTNASLHVCVRTVSGEIWIDDINLWNFAEYNNGTSPLPAYAGSGSSGGSGSGGGHTSNIPDVTPDPSFENSAWNLLYYGPNDIGQFGYSFDNTGRTGEKSLKGTFTDGKTGCNYFYNSVAADDIAKIKSGAKYHIELYAKGSEDSQAKIGIGIVNNGNAIKPTPHNGEFECTPGFWSNKYIALPTEWTLYKTASFTLESAETAIKIYFVGNSGENWIDDVRLVCEDETTLLEDGSVSISDFEGGVPSIDPSLPMTAERDTTVGFTGGSSMKISSSALYTDGAGIFAFSIPSDITEQLDVSTKYHLELAVKGAEGATVDTRFIIGESDRTSLPQMNYHSWNGEWTVNGLGTYNNTPTFSVPAEWDIYSTGSFGVTGGALTVKLQLRATENTTIWVDDIRLVPDRIEPANGKVIAKFDKETQSYTLTAVANKGYKLNSLEISAGNAFTPAITDKPDMHTTVYAPYTLGKNETSGTDVWAYASATEPGYCQWPTVNADFGVNDNPYLGDINCDGEVNILDLICLKKYLAGATVDFENTELCNADLDGDCDVAVTDLAALRIGLLTGIFEEE